MKYKKHPCEHGHTGEHVIRAFTNGTYLGCYGGTPAIAMDDDDGPGSPETQLRSNARPTEESGASVGMESSGGHRTVALGQIMVNWGATSDEISAYLQEEGQYVPPNQVASRVGELRKGGWVQESGAVRKTRRGGKGIVWVYYEHLGKTIP